MLKEYALVEEKWVNNRGWVYSEAIRYDLWFEEEEMNDNLANEIIRECLIDGGFCDDEITEYGDYHYVLAENAGRDFGNIWLNDLKAKMQN